ncbi:MAG: universal stress protein [Myxococcales bacterium]|nr:universal stress protein [Myxococcales bacterium]
MQPRQILLATDLSPASWRAMPQAARLAYLGNGEVTIAHASATSIGGATEAKRLSAMREGLEQMDVTARCEALVDEPVEALLSLCESRNADVLVVTKHGERASGQVLGSVTYDLVRRSPVPVLVAHDPVTYDDPPRTRPAHWDRIVVSTDFSSASHAGVTVAAELCAQVGATLEIVTVVVDGRCQLEVTAEGVQWPPMPEELERWRTRSEDLLADMAASWPQLTVITRAVCAHEAGAAIVAVALEGRADLIVVPAHGRGPVETILLGSTSERVLQLSPLPVLVLRGHQN